MVKYKADYFLIVPSSVELKNTTKAHAMESFAQPVIWQTKTVVTSVG
jgi:hypothetical protein